MFFQLLMIWLSWLIDSLDLWLEAFQVLQWNSMSAALQQEPQLEPPSLGSREICWDVLRVDPGAVCGKEKRKSIETTKKKTQWKSPTSHLIRFLSLRSFQQSARQMPWEDYVSFRTAFDCLFMCCIHGAIVLRTSTGRTDCTEWYLHSILSSVTQLLFSCHFFSAAGCVFPRLLATLLDNTPCRACRPIYTQIT